MKIILDDFNYKGEHFKRYECELPQVDNIKDIPEDKIVGYIMENLDELSKRKGSA